MTKFSDVLAAGVTIRESANDGSDFSNPTADYRRLFLGEDGLLHVKDSAGTVTSPYTGGSNLVPTIEARGVNGASTTSLGVTISAAASGKRLIVVVGSSNRDVNTPTCTNVTFTEVLATNFSTTAYLSIYAGVVAGGSSGTTVTITATGSDFIAADVYTIADTLTPTAGTSATVTNTDASAQLGVKIGAITPTKGTFYVCAAYQVTNTTPLLLAMNAPFTTSSVRGTVGAASTQFVCALGYAPGGDLFGYIAAGGTSAADYAAGIVPIT